jgi:hypothetical protein
MKVFIGWSGTESHRVARELRSWLPTVLDWVEPFLSSEDIDKGALWVEEIVTELKRSRFGIICVTEDNLEKPWLNFEAGALALRFETSCVSPFLFRTKLPARNSGPLALFQSTRFTRDEVRRLVRSVCKASPVAERRLTVASMDDLFEAQWPKLERSLHRIGRHSRNARSLIWPVGGATPYRGVLRGIRPTRLDEFHAGARQQLDILGHSLTGLWKGGGLRAVRKALANGARIRILFLDPTQLHSDQIAQISRQIDKDHKAKIQESMEAALDLKADVRRTLGLDAAGRLQIAASHLITYVHIQRADDFMLVSQYSQAREPGRDAPTAELAAKADAKLFKFYEEEFDRIWGSATPVEEILSVNGIRADRSRVLAHLPIIQEIYKHVKGNEGRLPYPRMIVVLPNMSCTHRCKNCFTWQTKRMNSDQMAPELLNHILAEASRMGTTGVELSGGGEPLDHGEALRLLDALAKARRDANLRVGILTNGSGIVTSDGDHSLADALLRLDYARIGYTEFLDDPRSRRTGAIHQFTQILESWLFT